MNDRRHIRSVRFLPYASPVRYASLRPHEAARRAARRLAGATLLAVLVPAGRAGAQDELPADDSVAVRAVAPGVTYRRIVRPAGPWTVHVLEVDLRRPELRVRAVRACDALHGRERPSAIVRRLRAEGLDVVGALNADFFDLAGGTGASENNVVVDGELVKGVERTESPFDTFDNAHTQFALTLAGRPLFERFRLTGTVRTPHGRWPLGGVNAATPPAGTLALVTRWAGDTTTPTPVTGRDSSAAVAVALDRVAAAGDTVRYRVRGAPRRGGRVAIPERGAVLSSTGAARVAVERLRAGDRVTVVASVVPSRSRLRTLVGGWPRVVRGGRNVAAASDSVEGTFPRFSRNRHPRSAIAVTRDSATLLLVAVDGRRQTSVGMSLVELGDALLSLGAAEALNLDGGGSTALVVGDSLVNVPSDSAGERPVGNVVVVTRGERETRRRAGRVESCVLGR